jgi:hypothetical protein
MPDDVPYAQLLRHSDGIVFAGVVYQHNLIYQFWRYLFVGLLQGFRRIVCGQNHNHLFVSVHAMRAFSIFWLPSAQNYDIEGIAVNQKVSLAGI